MVVRRYLADSKGHALRATALAEGKSGPHMNGNTALQIGQSESSLPIPAIGGSDQVKKGIVLVNRDDRAIAECPSHGRKVSGEHPDFADKWTRHILLAPIVFPGGVAGVYCHRRLLTLMRGRPARV